MISGQPLYLLYSYSKRGAPAPAAPLLAAFATQATGSVRLQVTGRPPTDQRLGLLLAAEQPRSAEREGGGHGALQQLSSAQAPCAVELVHHGERILAEPGETAEDPGTAAQAAQAAATQRRQGAGGKKASQ